MISKDHYWQIDWIISMLKNAKEKPLYGSLFCPPSSATNIKYQTHSLFTNLFIIWFRIYKAYHSTLMKLKMGI